MEKQKSDISKLKKEADDTKIQSKTEQAQLQKKVNDLTTEVTKKKNDIQVISITTGCVLAITIVTLGATCFMLFKKR